MTEASARSQGQFQAGGTLREGSLYIVRPADEELPAALLRREFCYVLAPRQIGKSSLRVRTSQRLQAAGVRCVTIDLTTIGSRNSSAAEWYYGLLREVAEQLGLPDPEPFWREHRLLSPVHRWSRFLRDEVILAMDRPVVIFIDEVDALLSLNTVSRDDFFASVRAVYNARADDPRYGGLTFCLFGVALSADLIQDETRTPFNIGRGIHLLDFTTQEAEAFLPGLTQAPGDARATLDEVFKWTCGHPYMTQMICQTLCEEPPTSGSTPQGEDGRVAQVVSQLFLRRGRVLEPSLSYVEKWFERSDQPARTAAMLRLYGRLRAGERVPSRSDDPVQMALRLTGMATERQDDQKDDGGPHHGGATYLEVRNRIFADVFDARWVRDQMAKRLVSAPLLRWLESGKRDEFLLAGQALIDAQAWARDTADLTREETEFLDSSERAVGRQRAQKLHILFLTEVWKSTANYLLLYILVEYIASLGYSPSFAGLVNRVFFSVIYFSPLLGGYVADRGLGHRRSVTFSILLLAMGYFVFSIPHTIALWAGLVLLVIGHGLYKPNLTALVGGIYPQQDVRRDSAFFRYYLGLNIGAALGPILVTSLSGFSSMCAAAGVAMVVALLSFQHYPEAAESGGGRDTERELGRVFSLPSRPDMPESRRRADSADSRESRDEASYESVPGLVVDPSLMAEGVPSARVAAGAEAAPRLGGLIALARAAARDNDNRRFRALVLLVGVVAVPFWLAFYATGDIAERWLNLRTHTWLGLVFSPSARSRISAAQNPIFVVAMMPLMWGVVRWLRARGREPSTATKMTVGMVLLALALLLLMIPNSERGSSMWLFGSYCVLALAELCVVPIGYSLVTELSPPRMMATALGLWFIPMTIGKNLSIYLGSLWEVHAWPVRGYFGVLAMISLVAAVVLHVQMGRLRRGNQA